MTEKESCQAPLNHLIDEVGENPKDKSFLIKVLSIGFAVSMVIFSASFAGFCFWYAIKNFNI